MTTFGRRIYLEVGAPGSTGKRIDGLKITFEGDKDDVGTPNRAKISVFNLNADSAALLQREGVVVQLFAGYEGQVDLMFLGDVTRAITTIEGASARTVIESGDGHRAVSTTQANVTLKGETDVKAALTATIKDLVSNPDQIIKSLSGDVLDQKLPRGFTASGPVKTVLRGLAASRRFDWFYLDGELVILDRDSALKEPAVKVSRETGLIGSPARLTGAGSKGIQLRVTLNGKIRPRRLLDLESREFTGFYLVKKVQHRGDNFGGDHYTQIEAIEVVP